MGCVAVTPSARLALLLPLLLLCGCQLTGELVGAAAGGASAGATANPAVGIAVGVAVNAGINASFAYIQRKRQQAEQDAIATEVATMQAGEQRPWKINHVIPIGDEHGEVVVVRDIPNALAPCKALVFSVEFGERQGGHTALVQDRCMPRYRTLEVGACGAGYRAVGYVAVGHRGSRTSRRFGDRSGSAVITLAAHQSGLADMAGLHRPSTLRGRRCQWITP